MVRDEDRTGAISTSTHTHLTNMVALLEHFNSASAQSGPQGESVDDYGLAEAVAIVKKAFAGLVDTGDVVFDDLGTYDAENKPLLSAFLSMLRVWSLVPNTPNDGATTHAENDTNNHVENIGHAVMTLRKKIGRPLVSEGDH